MDMITICLVRLRIAIFVALPTSGNVLPPIITTIVRRRGGSNTIVYALVISRVDYGNVLLFGLPEMLLHKLKIIQNSAAGSLLGPTGETTPVLFKLHWLPVRYRIEIKLLLLV